MTLMEVLVSLAVSSVALLVIVGATNAVLTSRESAGNAMTQTLRAALGRQMIADVLSGAVASPDPESRFDATNQTLDGIDDDAIAFVTRHDPTREAASAAAAFFIDRDTATVQAGLVLSVHSSVGRNVIELTRGASSFSVRYYSQGVWRAEWPAPTSLPEAVELRLGSGPGDSLPRLLRLPILVLLNGRGT